MRLSEVGHFFGISRLRKKGLRLRAKCGERSAVQLCELPKARMPLDHPLRPIRKIVDAGAGRTSGGIRASGSFPRYKHNDREVHVNQCRATYSGAAGRATERFGCQQGWLRSNDRISFAGGQLNVRLTITLTEPSKSRGMSARLWEDHKSKCWTTDDLAAMGTRLNRLMTNLPGPTWMATTVTRAHEFLFLPDALYAVGNNRFEGEAKDPRLLCSNAGQRGRTTTRHLAANLRVFRDDPRRARTVGVMSLYRADGSPAVFKGQGRDDRRFRSASACSSRTGCGVFKPHVLWADFRRPATSRFFVVDRPRQHL